MEHVRSSSFSVVRSLSLLVLLWACALVVGCSSQQPTAVGPPPAEIGWVQSFLGASADVVVFARPDGLKGDGRWGPLFREGNADLFDLMPGSGDEKLSRESKRRLNLARTYEVYVAFRSLSFDSANAIGYVAVLRGLPVTDPVELRGQNGAMLFMTPLRLPSGTLEYRPSGSYANDTKGLAPTIYITVDGTWVCVDQLTAMRAHDLFGSQAAPPPMLEPADDILLGGGLGLSATSFVSSSAGKKAPANLTQGLQTAGFAVHGGQNASVELFGTYASSDNASAAYDAYEEQCRSGKAACTLPAFLVRDMKIERDGKRLTWKITPSDALFNTLAEKAARGRF